MNTKEALSEKIIGFYVRSGFGRVLKSEMDLAVFHYFLLEYLPKDCTRDGLIDYFKINKTHIYNLSISIKLSEARVKKFLEEDFFLYKNDVEHKEYLLEIVNSTTISKGILKEGAIRFLVPNPIVRKFMEEKLYSIGGQIDYSENNEILVIRIFDFLKLVDYYDDKVIGAIIRKNLLVKAKLSPTSSEGKNLIAEIEKLPIEERLLNIARGLAGKLVGKAGDELIGLILDAAKNNLRLPAKE